MSYIGTSCIFIRFFLSFPSLNLEKYLYLNNTHVSFYKISFTAIFILKRNRELFLINYLKRRFFLIKQLILPRGNKCKLEKDSRDETATFFSIEHLSDKEIKYIFLEKIFCILMKF